MEILASSKLYNHFIQHVQSTVCYIFRYLYVVAFRLVCPNQSHDKMSHYKHVVINAVGLAVSLIGVTSIMKVIFKHVP